MSAILLLDGVMIIISFYVADNNYLAMSKHLVTIRNAKKRRLVATQCDPRIRNYLLQKSSYSKFAVKIFQFRYHGNRGLSETNIHN